ncbi:hypothetical protein DVH24_019815 [Malus domestica]|uniref:Cytochrome P450 n=1 Tax=Malus domestica TaxID=3750 RepID=A0A498I4R1_MALDO|nr:hypothetical protein DVH24_019815 [Malus domestica]
MELEAIRGSTPWTMWDVTIHPLGARRRHTSGQGLALIPNCHIPAWAPTTARARLHRSTILSILGPYHTFTELTREIPMEPEVSELPKGLHIEVVDLTTWVVLIWVATAILLLARQLRRWRSEDVAGQLPPGPRRWPVVGNIFQLGLGPPHESLAVLARNHGPIMTLWLGSMSTVVISSSQVAREMFKNHDVALAGRKIYEAMKGDYGNEGSLITAQYGPHWRMLRRLCTTEFFVTSRLDAMRGVRGKCIDGMLQFIMDASSRTSSEISASTDGIDLGRFIFLMAFNLIGNLIFSKDLLDPKSERGAMFFYHAGKVMELAGKPNMADFFPILRWLDPQGIRRNTQFHVEKAFEIAGEFIKERMESTENGGCDGIEKAKDFLDVLLEYRGDGVDEASRFTSPRTINVIVFKAK